MASWPLFLVYISSLSLCDGIVYKFQCIWIKIHPKVAGSIFVTFGVIRQIWTINGGKPMVFCLHLGIDGDLRFSSDMAAGN